MLRSKSYGVKELICKLALAYLDQLCVPWRDQKLQRWARKVDVGIMGHLSSSVNFLGCDYWKKARFMVLHNKDMEILKIKLFQ